MAQARIYWDLEHWPMVEKIFRQSAEFCSEHELWKLNVAHVFFLQETKFKEAIRYYDPIVKKHSDTILDVTAIVLANLCVSYIMTSQNEEAEELKERRKGEKAAGRRVTGATSPTSCSAPLPPPGYLVFRLKRWKTSWPGHSGYIRSGRLGFPLNRKGGEGTTAPKT